MSPRTMLPFLCLFVMVTNLLGTMTIKELRAKLTSSDQAAVSAARLYVTGIAEGITAANAGAEVSIKVSLFCQPRRLSLNTDNLIEMLNQYLKKLSSKTTQDRLDDFDVPTVLFNSLVDTFPCSEKR